MAPGHNPGGAVFGREIVQHPGVLHGQGEIGQGLRQLTQGHIHVPGASLGGMGADAGGAQVGEDAVLAQNPPDQFQDMGFFNQVQGPIRLGRQIHDALRPILIEEQRQVKEQFHDLVGGHRPGGVPVESAGVSDPLHDSRHFGRRGGVALRDEGLDGVVVGPRGAVARVEGPLAFLLEEPVDFPSNPLQPLPVQDSFEHHVSLLVEVLDGLLEIDRFLHVAAESVSNASRDVLIAGCVARGARNPLNPVASYC